MEHLEILASKFGELQDQTCRKIENSDGSGTFSRDKWEKDIGHGITRVMTGGDLIEKGAVNFSKVSGPVSDKMARVLGVEGERFSAAGLSSIFHGKNPFIPSIHMNVRYFSMNNGVEWFGGGIDLNPIYINLQEAKDFHTRLKNTCDQYHPDFYPEFKKWADDYFYLPHRNETRGVGGIFFDRQKPSEKLEFDQWFHFITELAALYPVIYSELMTNNANKPYTDQNLFWKKIRLGRYVEFNLVYDRGTRFGLESGGNTESILISLPPEARWEYNYQPEPGSEEQRTQQYLKKGMNWIN